MRISDWSSDVCSSDLVFRTLGKLALLLLPAGILASRVILVSALYGDYQAVQFRGCDIGRAGYGSLVLMLLVAPIAEELLFRGWAYAFLERVYSTKWVIRSEEHTSELQSLMRISYAVFCLKKKI